MCSGRCAGARNAAASMGVLKAAARRSTESCGYPPADFNLVIMMIGEVFVALASPATRPPARHQAQNLRTLRIHTMVGYGRSEGGRARSRSAAAAPLSSQPI